MQLLCLSATCCTERANVDQSLELHAAAFQPEVVVVVVLPEAPPFGRTLRQAAIADAAFEP